MTLFYALILGGFGASFAVALSYFQSRRLGREIKTVLGVACLMPLASLVLLFGGLFTSGHQWLATIPCVGSGILFLVSLGFGGAAPLLTSPGRALAGVLSIGWSGVVSFYSSHYCFMGACC